MRLSSPRLLLFDNGFFRKLVNKDSGETFFQGVLHSDLPVFDQDWKPWRTPSAVLEWIGLKPSKLPPPPTFSLNSPISEQSVDRAFDHFKKHYSRCADLQSHALRNRAMEQERWIHHDARHIWDAVMHEIFSSAGFADWVHTALAFDAVHKLGSLPHSTVHDFYSLLIVRGFFVQPRAIRNLSKFRLAKRLWDLAWERTWRRLPLSDQEKMKHAHKAMRIDSQDDGIDCDLVHLSIVGAEDENGIRHTVTCLTCDKPEELKIRLGVYRGLIRYARHLYDVEATQAGYPQNYETLYNGEVYCFDENTGCLVEQIDVSVDTCPISFLGNL